MMEKEKKHFDADKLLRTMYHRIAVWHNNDDRLGDEELQRELKFICQDLMEDVLSATFGTSEVKVDKDVLETDESREAFEQEKAQRMKAMIERLKAQSKESSETA